jgi:hypothetical protein
MFFEDDIFTKVFIVSLGTSGDIIYGEEWTFEQHINSNPLLLSARQIWK